MTRWDVCNQHLCRFRSPRFLEIGVSSGRGGRLIHADFKIGVDPVLAHDGTGYQQMYVMRSDEFFASEMASRLEQFHVILVDGLHHSDQVLRDIIHSLDLLSDNGLIVVHDCNPKTESAQMVPRPQGQIIWNGDCWKAIVWLRAVRRDLSVHTIDSDYGLGVVRRSDTLQDLISAPDSLSAMTWAGLVEHRAEWLGLMANPC